MWDQGISPTRRRRIYPDANPLFLYPGSGDQRGIYHPPGAGASSPQDGRKIKIRGSAISLETAPRHGRGLVVCTTPMSHGDGTGVRRQESEFRMAEREDLRRNSRWCLVLTFVSFALATDYCLPPPRRRFPVCS